MTFLEAAHEILKSAKQALHYAEITKRALDAGLLETQGQTPEATMGSRLYVDSKKPTSRFQRTGKGMFTIAQQRSGDVVTRIEALNRNMRKELHERVRKLISERFEALIGELLLALGFDEETVEVTQYGGDGGIDVRGVLRASGITEVHAAVQAKKWKGNVQAPVVRNLRGSLRVHEQGIIITTSDYSSGASTEAAASGKSRISLINGKQLVDLLVQYGIGVQQEQHTLLSLDSEWWDEMSGESASPEIAKPSASTIGITYPAPVQANFHGDILQAELLDVAGRIRTGGVEYGSPSAAGKAATGWKACDGWKFWRYQDDNGTWRPIGELRAAAK